MKTNQICALLQACIGGGIGLLAFPTLGLSEWSVDRPGIATLPEVGGRATLFIQCTQQGAEPALYLHQPLNEEQLTLIYRFDNDQAQTRAVLLHSGQVWPAPGSEGTELGVLMELEVDHGTTEVYAGVQT